MKEKEFRKLRRFELVEIIYQLEKDLEEAKTENAGLRDQLKKKDAELKNAMSLEKAVRRLNRISQSAEMMQKEYAEKKDSNHKKGKTVWQNSKRL